MASGGEWLRDLGAGAAGVLEAQPGNPRHECGIDVRAQPPQTCGRSRRAGEGAEKKSVVIDAVAVPGEQQLCLQVRDRFTAFRELGFDPREDEARFGRIGPKLRIRRHLIQGEALRNCFPFVDILARRHVAIDGMQGEFTLLLFRAVTLDAVLLEKRGDAFSKAVKVRTVGSVTGEGIRGIEKECDWCRRGQCEMRREAAAWLDDLQRWGSRERGGYAIEQGITLSVALNSYRSPCPRGARQTWRKREKSIPIFARTVR